MPELQRNLLLWVCCLSFTLKMTSSSKHCYLSTRLHSTTCQDDHSVNIHQLETQISCFPFVWQNIGSNHNYPQSKWILLFDKDCLMWSRCVEAVLVIDLQHSSTECNMFVLINFFLHHVVITCLLLTEIMLHFTCIVTPNNYLLHFTIFLPTVVLLWNESGYNFGIWCVLYSEL